MVPSNASQETVDLARAVAPVVFEIDPGLYEAEFQRIGAREASLDSGAILDSEGCAQPPEAKTCNFALAFPVQQELEALSPPYVILDGLVSSQNVGQILRTAYHLGVTSVVSSRSSWNCVTGRAARVSMGWLYDMDFHLAHPLSTALQNLRAKGVKLYAAEEHFPEPVAPHMPRGDRNWGLIVGHEDQGVSAESIGLSQACIRVPQRKGESLNVAHATAICLYELSRHMDT